MTTGTGLDAQLGFAAEVTVGTAVTVSKFLEFDSESLTYEPTWQEPTGLRVGRKYKRASRLKKSRSSVSGDIQFQYPTRGTGLLWKMALGSSVSAPTALTAPAYKQVHQPG